MYTLNIVASIGLFCIAISVLKGKLQTFVFENYLVKFYKVYIMILNKIIRLHTNSQ